ncbi:hypothetical protein KCE64_004733 [Salmonella enterica subsp. enterica serovar Hvittingfoss]|nr:hypothetical protein [Salmonella enterica subsp. enterica serovar Hvittingfoss]EHL2852226.1 hypothetical protein [Salmonella enterica subsp. enterica serovar Hvittingfoss]
MAYHLSVVEIREEINQQDTPPSSNPHTPQMTITRFSSSSALALKNDPEMLSQPGKS